MRNYEDIEKLKKEALKENARKGGEARKKKLTPERRSEIARMGGLKRAENWREANL